MSTKPKARKFRIRRSVQEAQQEAEQHAAKPADTSEQMFAPPKDDGFGSQSFPSTEGYEDEESVTTPVAAPASRAPKADAPKVSSDDAPTEPGDGAANNTIDAIRREGLTGRQLRMARRVAQKQGMSPTSDFDAVRQLRDAGIDPFKRANMLELVVSDARAGQRAPNTPMGQALQTAPGMQITPTQKPAGGGVPSTEVLESQDRARDVMDIQRDIARRRRRRAMMLAVRMLFFVLLPTALAGVYYYSIATPMYGTKSEFVIQSADPAGGGAGGLLSGSPLGSSQDSITVQGYLQSRDAMLRLDADEGFRQHFSQDFIDPIQRLDPDASQEDAYKRYQKSVKIGYDPTEGIIKMEVIAASPEESAEFSKQLITYAEQQVDQLTARKREDQMQGADKSRKDAERKMVDAQNKIVEIQEKLGVLSPESEVQAVFGQITQLESELLTERISLQQFLANARPNDAKVSAARNKVEELERLIDEKRSQLTESSANSGSLARISGQLLVAQADLEVRQGLLAQAEGAFEAARLEANRQVRYLSVAVNPIAPDEPTYPRAFENTILAFLIFSGIYLMVSLTSSILREQV